MRKKATEALIEMGIPANIRGFEYIIDAMCLFEDEEWRKGKILTLYWKVAQINKTTPSRVERSIRYAFETVIRKGHSIFVKKYLTLDKTTNSNYLSLFYLRLTQEE